MHLNTVIAPVYWELIEPTAGKFDWGRWTRCCAMRVRTI